MSSFIHIVPFKLNDLYGGFAKAYGLVKIENSILVIEIETQDTITGMIKSGVRRFEFQIPDIRFVILKKGVFTKKIEIGFNNMRAIEQFPHRKEDKIDLIISKKDLDSALTFISHLNLLITEHRFQSLNSDFDDI